MEGEWLTVAGCSREIKAPGKRSIYRAIQRKELRACAINERGDLRVHRDWLRAYAENQAEALPRREPIADKPEAPTTNRIRRSKTSGQACG